MPVPVRCGANAHCLGDSTCVCNEVKSQTSTRQNNFLSRDIMETLIPVVDFTCVGKISVQATAPNKGRFVLTSVKTHIVPSSVITMLPLV